MSTAAASEIVIVIPGIPQPAGSKRSFIVKGKGGGRDRAVTVDANKKQKSWQLVVRECAMELCTHHWEMPAFLGPVEVSVRFRFPRPKSHYGSGKNARIVKKTAPCYCSTKPDLDKLLRALNDSLTGIVWRDDSQVVCFNEVAKIYTVGPGEAIVRVRPLAPTESL